MGRLVYQTIPEEKASESKHGQLISDIYTGHISVNHNNVINSATKRIENKLNDVLQLQNNIIEQENVVNNLTEDYQYFLNNQLPNLYETVYDLYAKANICIEDISHIRRGISTEEDVNGNNKGVLLLLEKTINEGLDHCENVNNIHKFTISYYLNQLNFSRDCSSLRMLGYKSSVAELLQVNTENLLDGDSFLVGNILYVWNTDNTSNSIEIPEDAQFTEDGLLIVEENGETKYVDVNSGNNGSWKTPKLEDSINTIISRATTDIEDQYTKAQLLRNTILKRME